MRRPDAVAGRDARSARASFVISIPSQTAFLGLIRELTRKMSACAGFDAGIAEQVALAVDEATTNVIEHAYHGAGDKRVELRLEDRGPELWVEILDSGARVDPRRFPEVDLERYKSERRTGGLGVHLMGKIMDSVSFERRARRNVCRLAKRKHLVRAGER